MRTIKDILRMIKCEIGFHEWIPVRDKKSVVLHTCIYCTAEKYEIRF